MPADTDSPPVVIRRADAADARPLASFAAAAFADTFAADNTPGDMASYLVEAFGEDQQLAELDDPACIVLVAEHGGELAGYAMVRDGAMPGGTTSADLGNAMEIARLYAGRRWVGTGVGAALMQSCLDLATSRRREWVWLGVWERNARAIAFYARWGFTDIGSQPFQLGADRQSDRILARRTAAQE